MNDEIRRKLVFHVLEKSPDGRVTNRYFFKEILPKFPVGLHGKVIAVFFGMSEWTTQNGTIYHQLKKEHFIQATLT